MSTKVLVTLSACFALVAVAAVGADQSSNRPAPGETRSIFQQGAVDRLKQMFSGNADDESAAPAPTTTTRSTPRAASNTRSSPRRVSTRTAARSYGRSNLLNRPRTTASRTPMVEETNAQEDAAPTVPAPAAETATAESVPGETTETGSFVAAAPEAAASAPIPAITLPRQEASLGDSSTTPAATAPATQPIAANHRQPLIRAAERSVTPKELATLASGDGAAFDIPRTATSLLATDDRATEKPFEVGLSPAPRLIPQQPVAEEPAPAHPSNTAAAPPADIDAVPPAIVEPTEPERIAATAPPQPMRMTTIVPRSAPPAVALQPEVEPAAPQTTLIPQPEVQPQPIAAQPAPQPTSNDAQAPTSQPESTAAVVQPTIRSAPTAIDAPPARNTPVMLRPVEAPQPAPPAVARLTATMVGPKEIYSGDTGIFRVKLANVGDAPAKEVRVEIRADDVMVKTLNVGDIPAKSDVELEIALSPNKIGALDLRAIATGGEGAKAVAGSVVFIGKPELSLAIAGPPQINVGDLKTYTAILNNTGNVDATNVRVLVMLQGEESQSLTVGVVPAGQTRQVRFELRSEQAGQLAVNAVATADGNVQAVADGSIHVVQHEVQLALEGPRQIRFGEKAIYTLVLANHGNADAQQMTVYVTLGESQLDGLYEGTLPAGTEEKISFEVSPNKPGFHTLHAVAMGADDVQATTTAKVQVQHGQLELAAESPTASLAGNQRAYAVRVKNTGDASAEDVLITAHLPEGVKYLGGVDRIEFYEGVTWRVGQLLPGEEQAYEVQCELSAAGQQQIVFSATGADELEASQTVTTAVEGLADVRLLVADPQGLVPVGQDVVYEIEVHNRGAKPAHNVEVVMQLATALEPIHVAGGDAQVEARGVVFDPIPTLAAQETVTLRVTARANEKGSHQFRVEMTADEPTTFIASEGTTQFYGSNTVDDAATAVGEE